jgi:hypothetical protein
VPPEGILAAAVGALDREARSLDQANVALAFGASDVANQDTAPLDSTP